MNKNIINPIEILAKKKLVKVKDDTYAMYMKKYTEI